MTDPRLQRQSFLGPDSDAVLARCCVGVVGLGGGGSHIAQQLAHVGVGQFRLFDPDRVEDTNLNRLVGATAADVAAASYKTAVTARVVHGVNPAAQVQLISDNWQTAAELLRDCDVVFGCLDSFIERDQLERAVRRYLTPYIDIGMDVHALGDQFLITGQVALSLPGQPCLWCMGLLREELLAGEAAEYGAAGGRPQVVWPNGVLASTAVGLFMQLVTPWHHYQKIQLLLEYDGNIHSVQPSNKLLILDHKTCSHYAAADVGDPFFASV